MRRKLTFELAIEELKKAKEAGKDSFKVYGDRELNVIAVYVNYFRIVENDRIIHFGHSYYLDPIETTKEVIWKQGYNSSIPNSNTIITLLLQSLSNTSWSFSFKGLFLRNHSYKATIDNKSLIGTIVEIPNEDTPEGTYLKNSDNVNFRYQKSIHGCVLINPSSYTIITKKEYIEDSFKVINSLIDRNDLSTNSNLVNEILEYYFKVDPPERTLNFRRLLNYICDRTCRDSSITNPQLIDYLVTELIEYPYKDLSGSMIDFLKRFG